MLSKNSQIIVKDVDNVRNNTDIESLLQKYQEKPHRDFIQKYAEIKIAINGYKVTKTSYLFALMAIIVAVMLSISLFFYPEYYTNNKNSYNFLLIVFFIFFIFTTMLFIFHLFKKEVLEDIIIAILDDKLTIPISVDPIVIPKSPPELKAQELERGRANE